MSAITVLTFSSCEKIKEKLFESFTAEGANIQFSIPIVTTTNEINIGSSSVQLNVDSTIKAATGGVFGIDILKEVNPEEVTLKLLNADELNNLANFESFKVQVSASGNSNPIVIASMANPNTYAESVKLTVDNTKQLLGLLKASSAYYEVKGKARRPTIKQLNAQLIVKLKFK